jgi:hypothetical protein
MWQQVYQRLRLIWNLMRFNKTLSPLILLDPYFENFIRNNRAYCPAYQGIYSGLNKWNNLDSRLVKYVIVNPLCPWIFRILFLHVYYVQPLCKICQCNMLFKINNHNWINLMYPCEIKNYFSCQRVLRLEHFLSVFLSCLYVYLAQIKLSITSHLYRVLELDYFHMALIQKSKSWSYVTIRYILIWLPNILSWFELNANMGKIGSFYRET